MSYWDSSALAKLYVEEADSPLFEHYAANAPLPPITSRLALYELRTVLERKESDGVIVIGAAHSIYQQLVQDATDGFLRIVELSDDVAREFETVLAGCFRRTPPIFLRTLDGIHLASALVAAQEDIIATDKRLREAATVLGFKTFP